MFSSVDPPTVKSTFQEDAEIFIQDNVGVCILPSSRPPNPDLSSVLHIYALNIFFRPGVDFFRNLLDICVVMTDDVCS